MWIVKEGICAAISRLIRRRSVVDIIERFQTEHALQEEREMKNRHSPTSGAVEPGAPNKNGMRKIPRNKESAEHHAGIIVGRFHLSVNKMIQRNQMRKHNYERFLYLQRGSRHQPIGGTEESHACPLAAENNPPKADRSRTIGIRA